MEPPPPPPLPPQPTVGGSDNDIIRMAKASDLENQPMDIDEPMTEAAEPPVTVETGGPTVGADAADPPTDRTSETASGRDDVGIDKESSSNRNGSSEPHPPAPSPAAPLLSQQRAPFASRTLGSGSAHKPSFRSLPMAKARRQEASPPAAAPATTVPKHSPPSPPAESDKPSTFDASRSLPSQSPSNPPESSKPSPPSPASNDQGPIDTSTWSVSAPPQPASPTSDTQPPRMSLSSIGPGGSMPREEVNARTERDEQQREGAKADPVDQPEHKPPKVFYETVSVPADRSPPKVTSTVQVVEQPPSVPPAAAGGQPPPQAPLLATGGSPSYFEGEQSSSSSGVRNQGTTGNFDLPHRNLPPTNYFDPDAPPTLPKSTETAPRPQFQLHSGPSLPPPQQQQIHGIGQALAQQQQQQSHGMGQAMAQQQQQHGMGQHQSRQIGGMGQQHGQSFPMGHGGAPHLDDAQRISSGDVLQAGRGQPPQQQGIAPPHLDQGQRVASADMALQHEQQQQQRQHLDQGLAAQGPPHAMDGGPPDAGGIPGMRELRVEDALLYLDDVKREFKDRPAIYNEFLGIMKNFKSQEVDTPGVIARVSRLFHGYNNLILGFNTFLPDGYKIRSEDLPPEGNMKRSDQPMDEGHGDNNRAAGVPDKADKKETKKQKSKRVSKANAFGGKGQQHSGAQGQSPPSGSSQQQSQGQWGRTQDGKGMPPPSQEGQSGRNNSFQAMPQQPPPQQHQAVEFDHAISYVTTIKKRFSSDPNTYHSFLEILHTYQKEQRGIKEVLEQVAHLFQDHPDLLKEFTFFLPDAVQEQAKERLHRAAAESETRLAALRHQQQQQNEPQRAGGGASGQFIDMSLAGGAAAADAASNSRKRDAEGQALQMAETSPESCVYNSAVERQFFDSAREALSSYSRDGGQAWAEFLKCLDMYAQEILSRSEMLNFVEPLLGKRHNNLFEEFKRILSAAGSPELSTQLIEDAWYSVPLAEIDFSRCRRCSPSYRALPRDYPAHPCSDRSEEEARVLNDVWVSLPVGSEESYTFRHMRRNTYEETLFRVEDERFEIDMVIDSNAATLQRLEPIAEEIALLSQEDTVPSDLGLKVSSEGTGLGGKRFQYSFDKSILGVIHRNSIARIYGDNGPEMLELLMKNPTVAVPLVVQRLRQKDTEWRVVRNRLNRSWKDLAEHNYYKSVDHRSLTWRTTDKRAISSRTLVAEIKDRALNGGRESKEALRQKLDKAKEEHGTFYEVTVGEKLTQNLDLTFLPKPDRRLFTPHLSLMYTNVSWAQRDAYRILAFALERGPISPSDKERCHRLWVEFLGPWFDLSLSWMQKPAVNYQESTAANPGVARSIPAASTVVSEDDEESMDEEPEIMSHIAVTEELTEESVKDKEFTDHHPLPAGAHVSTLYGEGTVIEFRRSDHIYAVRLNFGAIGYLRPATVLCSMLPVEKSAYTRQLRADDRTKLARPNDQLAFGTQSLYLFFRLHQILVNRLNTAKRLAFTVGDDKSLQSMVEQMPNTNKKAIGRRRYEAYLSLVYSLLDGGVGGAAEGGKYEDRVRSLLGHGAYELATMDKLIAHIWKDIQTMANDETMWNLVQLYRRHMLAGSFQPEAFRQEAAYLSDGEPMFAFQHCPLSSNDASVLHIEHLGVMDDEDDDGMEEEVEPVVEQPPPKRSKR